MSDVRLLDTLTEDQALAVALDIDGLADDIGVPASEWGNRCHEISLKLLKSGAFGKGRIARGIHTDCPSQHSWIVLGDDCYDPDAVIVDPTCFSFRGEAPVIVVTTNRDPRYKAHGAGYIFDVGMPPAPTMEPITLDPDTLTTEANDFLQIVGPLDIRGWAYLASNCPVEGWPAREIIIAMRAHPSLRAVVPIDIVGMLTEENPNNAYF